MGSVTGWHGIRIVCASGATCLPTDYCFSELLTGTYKVRNEIETKRNETKSTKTKRNEINKNETKRNENEMKRNQRKQNEIN
jgi:hypothetical protein